MKRSNFILTATTLLASPFTALAQSKAGRTDKGFKTPAGEGRLHGHLKLKGVNSNVLDLKVGGSDTGGGFALFEQTSLSQGRGTPLHVHHKQDEVFYIVEGTYRFKIGDDLFDGTAGDTIFLPMKVPHAWTQISERGKMMVLFQPAGKMEGFFSAVAALKNEPTQAEMSKLFADNEMEIVGPPLKMNG